MSETLEWLLGPPVGYLLAVLWGATWGSFYNVLIVFGEGRRASLVRPASHCLSCQTPIRVYDNIPIISFLVLRGRCRSCGARFSARYLIIELLAALLSLLLYWRFVAHDPYGAPFAQRLGHYLIYEKFAGLLLTLSAIDLTLLIIPDRLTYPSIPTAMALSLLLPLDRFWDGLVGAVAGYAFVWVVANAYYLIRRREGMGLGDAKLLAIIGAILGWRALPYVIFLASLQGSLLGIVGIMAGMRLPRGPTEHPQGDDAARKGSGHGGPDGDDDDRPGRHAEAGPDGDDDDPPTSLRFAAVPFGPFLAVAALEFLFLQELLRRYLYLFGL